MPTRLVVRAGVLSSLVFGWVGWLSAQEAGRIIGRIVEADQGNPVAGAQVELVDAPIRAVSALDGRYVLPEAPAGPVSIRVRMIGFAPKLVTGVVVPAGGTVAQDVAMVAEAVQLEEIAVTAEAERGTVNRALEEQRNANTIVSAVTAEQIQKSPDSDAGQAVQRVSGVTVQDGKYVFVRGLGERYTTTSLNGTRIPSPDPERKVVPLDLFPAGLLESITTSKTFTPEQPGDFSGAQVDLKTREFPAQRLFSLSISGGLNAAATGKDIIRAPRTGSEWLGFGGSRRELPPEIRDANTLAGLPQSTQNRFLTLFRNSWSAPAATGSPNGSFGLAVGGEGSVAGQQLGYIGSFTYSYGQEVRKEESRATVVRSSNGTGTEAYSAYEGSSGRTSVLWGGVANLSTRLGANSKIAVNNTYSRTADNEATFLDGDHRDWGLLQATRLTFTERSVRSNQLAGEHLLGLRHQISWALTSSGVRRNEPDRSDLLYERDRDPTTSALVLRWSTAPQAATRTFSDLKEDAFDLGLNYRLSLKVSGENALKAGLLARRVDRDADSRAYDITQINLTDAERAQAPEEIFDGGFAESGRLRLTANANGGRYEAADRLVAGYIQGELQLTHRLRGVLGARLEHDRLDVDTRETQSAEIRRARLDDTDLLPAVALTYALSDDQNLRLSASQTLSRPEYRELAPVRYFDILGNLAVNGNANLTRALIRNLDTRWEWYPQPGEVISLGVFAKFFDDPIERVFVFQAGGNPELSFANAASARNYGVEAEVRKSLALLAGGLRSFTVFANATVMHSRITPGSDSLSAATASERPMTGQSDYVVNAGLGYGNASGSVSATLLYNVVGRRISEAAPRPLPDTYEEARHQLDATLQVQPWANWRVKLDGRNLLDSPYRFTQGDVLRLRYKSGRQVALGFGWNL